MGVSNVIQTIHLHPQIVESCDPGLVIMEKMESINQMTENTVFTIKNTLFVTKNNLFVSQMTQNTRSIVKVCPF